MEQGDVFSLYYLVTWLQITLKTRNVFIESTATDLTKANIVLNTIVRAQTPVAVIPGLLT